jgi:hypothetical protein
VPGPFSTNSDAWNARVSFIEAILTNLPMIPKLAKNICDKPVDRIARSLCSPPQGFADLIDRR